MYKALFYKEWIKLRWFLLIITGIVFFTYLKIFLNISAAIEIKGGFHLWTVVAQKGAMVYSGIKYLLPIAGAVIAAVQFVPETRQRRLRLLFHLPVDHNKSLGFMLLTGFIFIILLIVLNILFLILMMSCFFPYEIVHSALVSSAPWLFSGIPAYFGVGLCVLEPAWWRKTIYGIAAFLIVMFFFYGSSFNVYEHSLWKYILVSCLYVPTALLPAFRFKRGLN